MTCFPENLQDTDNGQLFSGTEKEERFRKIIKRLLHGHEGDMIYDRCRLLRGALSLTKVSYNIMTSPVCFYGCRSIFATLGTRYPVAGYRYPGTSFPRVSHILPGTGTVPGGPAIWNGVPVTGTRYPDTYL